MVNNRDGFEYKMEIGYILKLNSGVGMRYRSHVPLHPKTRALGPATNERERVFVYSLFTTFMRYLIINRGP